MPNRHCPPVRCRPCCPSDREWCTYAELDGIAIHQLLTDEVDKAVTTALVDPVDR